MSGSDRLKFDGDLFECSSHHHRYATFVIFKASLSLPFSLSYWHFRCVLNTPLGSDCDKVCRGCSVQKVVGEKRICNSVGWTKVFSLNNSPRFSHEFFIIATLPSTCKVKYYLLIIFHSEQDVVCHVFSTFFHGRFSSILIIFQTWCPFWQKWCHFW